MKKNIFTLMLLVICQSLLADLQFDGVIYDVSGAIKMPTKYNDCDLWVWDGESSVLTISAYTSLNWIQSYPPYDPYYYYYLYCNGNQKGQSQSSNTANIWNGKTYHWVQNYSLNSDNLSQMYNAIYFAIYCPPLYPDVEQHKTQTIYISTQSSILKDTITFDANGGLIPTTGNMGSTISGYTTSLSADRKKGSVVVIANTSAFNSMPNDCPTRTGYTFEGWYTDKTAGTQVYNASGYCVVGKYWNSDKKWIGTSNLTVYAHWKTVQYTISTSATNGIVTGGGTFGYNATATLTAIPNDCYQFIKWSDNNTDNPRSITVTQDSTFTAIFEKIQFNLSIDVNDSEHSEVGTKEVEE